MIFTSAQELEKILNKKEDFLNDFSKEINDSLEVKKSVKKFPVTFCDDGIKLQGTEITLSGNAIREHLKNCTHCYIFLATLGDKIDRLSDKLQLTDMSKAYILDTAANEIIERYCDEISNEIEKEELSKGNKVTLRFSPGYADLPLEIQKQIIKVLGGEKMGVYLSDTLIMKPFKSVSAIIGVGKKAVKGSRDYCAVCKNNKSCDKRICK